MIIFDLDGTLANCEHRKHFVDSKYMISQCKHETDGFSLVCVDCFNKIKKWKPDWDAFHEACDQDTPIYPVWDSFNHIRQWHEDYAIWSGRSESVRKKTINWLMNRCPLRPTYWNEESWNCILKMRPIGDYTPDDQLKEQWLDEAIAEGKTIDWVFDDRPKVIQMWRRRGIFVFDVCQGNGEF